MTPIPLPPHAVHLTGLLVLAIALVLAVLPAAAAEKDPAALPAAAAREDPAAECMTKSFRRLRAQRGTFVNVLSPRRYRKDAKRIAALIDRVGRDGQPLR